MPYVSTMPELSAIAFDADGLVPAIAQQHDTGEVLMLAWMNRAALEETLTTGRVCYYSRSRRRLWRKGESSGQAQHVRSSGSTATATRCLLLVRPGGRGLPHRATLLLLPGLARERLVESPAEAEIAPEQLYG